MAETPRTPERTLAYTTFCPASKDGVSEEKCLAAQTVMLDPEDVKVWTTSSRSERPPVQELFHYLTPDEREVLMSGICPSCWERIFGGEDDD